jgi:ribose 5-phosphate isomerase B
MKIAIGTDHHGVTLKNYIIDTLTDVEWLDKGAFDQERTDYPLYADLVVASLLHHEADAGILLCGSGVGMSIAANRHDGIFAALVWNTDVARLAKEHDNANIIVLPADFIQAQDAVAMIRAWKKSCFLGGRYQERVAMIGKK